MKVKELIEILKKADMDFEVKISDFEGNLDADIEHIDHADKTVYLLYEG